MAMDGLIASLVVAVWVVSAPKDYCNLSIPENQLHPTHSPTQLSLFLPLDVAGFLTSGFYLQRAEQLGAVLLYLIPYQRPESPYMWGSH